MNIIIIVSIILCLRVNGLLNNNLPEPIVASERACFNAKDASKSTIIKAPKKGIVSGIKLEHLDGYVECDNGRSSKFGCSNHGLFVYLYDKWGAIKLPNQYTKNGFDIDATSVTFIGDKSDHSYYFDIKDPNTDPLILIGSDFSVNKDDEFTLQYSEAKIDYKTHDNSGTSCAKVIFYMKDEIDSIFDISADDIVCGEASYTRKANGIPRICDASHPKFDTGFCYKECKSGYYGVGPVCWKYCDEGYQDDGAFCTKHEHTITKDSYGRGAGEIPKLELRCCCGRKLNGLLCYDSCRKGYDDHGASCYKNIFDFYLKKPYDAEWVQVCPFNKPENDAGLCYPNCNEGYDGVGPVCWKYCPNGSVDLGALCQLQAFETYSKPSYVREGVIPPNCPAGYENEAGICYENCKPGYNGVGPVCWLSAFWSNFASSASSDDFDDIKECTKGLTNDIFNSPDDWNDENKAKAKLEGFDTENIQKCIDDTGNGGVIALEISFAASIGVESTGLLGIAFGNNGVYIYSGACFGIKSDISIGIDITIVVYSSLDAVAGLDNYMSLDFDIPFTPISIGGGIIMNPSDNCQAVGATFSIGVDADLLPISYSFGACYTNPVLQIAGFKRRRRSRRLLNSTYSRLIEMETTLTTAQE